MLTGYKRTSEIIMPSKELSIAFLILSALVYLCLFDAVYFFKWKKPDAIEASNERFNKFYNSQPLWVQRQINPAKYEPSLSYFIDSAYNYTFNEKEERKLKKWVGTYKRIRNEYLSNKEIDRVILEIVVLAKVYPNIIDTKAVYAEIKDDEFDIVFKDGEPKVIRVFDVPSRYWHLDEVEKDLRLLQEKVREHEVVEKLKGET